MLEYVLRRIIQMMKNFKVIPYGADQRNWVFTLEKGKTQG